MLEREWQKQKNQGHTLRLGPFVILSAIICFLLIQLNPDFWPEWEMENEKKSVELRKISSKDWLANKTIDSKSKPNSKAARIKKEKEKKKEVIKPDGQIVAIAMPEKEEVPDDRKLLSQYDSKVKKQTKAKIRQPANKVAPKKQNAGKLKRSKRPSQKQKSVALNTMEEVPKKENRIGKNLMLLPKLKMPLNLEKDTTGNRSSLKSHEGRKAPKQGQNDKFVLNLNKYQKGSEGKKSGRPNSIPQNLLPSLSNYDTGGAPMNDYLPNVEESDETWLNTASFMYATYYNRIQNKVASRWDPVRAQRRYDPTYAIYGYKNRHTVIYIVLDDRGELEDARIQRSCGVDFLDQEALAAITKAAPFPNPPDGIVEEDGKIRFPFGFYFEMTRSGLRLTGH